MRLDPTKVALLTNNVFPPREGVARHVLELALRFQALGLEPLIVARNAHSTSWQRETCSGVPVLRYPFLPVRPFHHALSARPLQRWLDEGAEGADLIHVHTPLMPKLRTRLRRVVTVHSPMLTDSAAITEGGVKPALLKLSARLVGQKLERHHLDEAFRVLAVSEGVKHELATHYGAEDVTVVPNGVDTKLIKPRFGDRTHGPLLYVGRLGYRKGLFRLLDALALLGNGAPALELIGEGPLQGALVERAEALGLGQRVTFAGFLDRQALTHRLHAARAVINPADYESGPLTLLEAMAAGAPVVSTRTGLVGEFERANRGLPPLLVAERTPEDLADAIEAVLCDPLGADLRAGDARSLVERRFDWDAVAERVLEAYGWRAARVAA